MTTQQTKVDWDQPIEAVHEDGRTMLVNGIHDWANDQWPHAGVADREHIYMRDDGRCSRATWGDMPGWRIRNVAQPKAPTPSPELTARMVAFVREIAGHRGPDRMQSQWQCKAHAIAAELDPVDWDRNEAERIAYDMEGALPRDLVEAGIKAGRKMEADERNAALKRKWDDAHGSSAIAGRALAEAEK